MDFTELKARRLEDEDLSRKGSIDKPIVELVNVINSMSRYCTTSSCSGRVILFENNSEGVQKKGCKWLHVSHELVKAQNILKALEDITQEAVFKFEPMVMHIQCDSLSAAQQMHQVAVAAGFRNSGITVGNKGKTMVAVRSTHGLEAPLSDQGKLLVSHDYVEYLTECANKKMEMNLSRIVRFMENVKELSERPDVPIGAKHRKKKEKPPRVDKSEAGKKSPAILCEPDSDVMSIFGDS
ncbi:tRNA wybutosine-synthesizing protein 3 homolog [Aplysia californica]|uniref:tRNA wybutosine-synthesizing protein 3 homolog n=1 Tax=Aplysia californica TaxID=6500 RepID=A0ABM0JIZ0_APLCA|nr:tRNA wybutosine-synthesizing protein 3 homolog [Aplysia californica]